MRRTAGKRYGFPWVAVILVAAIAGGLLALHYLDSRELSQQVPFASQIKPDRVDQKNMTAYYNGEWYRLREHTDTYLILGIDKFAQKLENISSSDLLNDLQSDFLALLVVNHDRKTYSAIQLNRDTVTEIRKIGYSGQNTGTVKQQLALSHTYGSGGKDSCRNSVDAVSRLLYDVPIDHYYAITMDAIPVLADLLDGIPVHIDEDMTAVDKTLVKGKDVTLHGEHALNFVRARSSVSDGTNLSRMNRQTAFLKALQVKLTEKISKSDRFAYTLAGSLEKYTTTDLITDEMVNMVTDLKGYQFTGITTIPGTAQEGKEYIEFYPDEEKLRQIAVDTFFVPVYDAESSVKS